MRCLTLFLLLICSVSFAQDREHVHLGQEPQEMRSILELPTPAPVRSEKKKSADRTAELIEQLTEKVNSLEARVQQLEKQLKLVPTPAPSLRGPQKVDQVIPENQLVPRIDPSQKRDSELQRLYQRNYGRGWGLTR